MKKEGCSLLHRGASGGTERSSNRSEVTQQMSWDWSPGFWIEVPASGLSLGALPSTPPPPLFSSISVTGTIWLSIDTCTCLRMWTDPVRSACGLNSSSLDGAASSDGGCPSLSTTRGSEWREMSSLRSPTTRLQLHPVLQPSISKGRKQLP